MRIDKLHLTNFKCFEDQSFAFHPNFNLIIGENASGKSSLLEAIKHFAKSFLFCVTKIDTTFIIKNDLIRVKGQRFGEEIRMERILPVKLDSKFTFMGEALGSDIQRQEELNSTTSISFHQPKKIGDLTEIINKSVRFGEVPRVTMPLIAYYDITRHKMEKEDYIYRLDGSGLLDGSGTWSPDDSGLAVYNSSMESGLPTKAFLDWFAEESWTEFESKKENLIFGKVKNAIIQSIEGATYINFSPKNKEIVVGFNDDYLLFSNLSDGQKSILLLIGDISRKMIQLNPHLGEKVLEETDGIVLIDELDLHLHPKWQRKIIGDLTRTFPKIQFFATTHSPQVISSAPHDSLILLTNSSGEIEVSKRNNSYGLNSNWILKHIMGDESRPKEIQDKINEIEELINSDDLKDISKARSKLDELKKIVLDDEITSLDTILSNLENPE